MHKTLTIAAAAFVALSYESQAADLPRSSEAPVGSYRYCKPLIPFFPASCDIEPVNDGERHPTQTVPVTPGRPTPSKPPTPPTPPKPPTPPSPPDPGCGKPSKGEHGGGHSHNGHGKK